jgi:2-oxoglutarate ferredoxin oxidoreductase subunit alpha
VALKLVMGNEAVAQGALAAGCDFFAGYPITPATEILEEMARLLPARGGVFLQMEDELGAMAAVIGAAWGGARAMTATSGPGFTLMQEHIGYAAITQTPCVVVDTQRSGPSTGQPTLPSQGDVMQARFGTHGDRPALALTASSVRGAYDRTRLAFALAERHRLPAVLLLDAVVSHMREPVDLPPPPPPARRAFAPPSPGAPRFGPHAAFVPFGVGEPTVVTGLAHGPAGTTGGASGAFTADTLRAVGEALAADPDVAAALEAYRIEDADVVLVAFGITARAAREAVDRLRQEGTRAGLVDLGVLWPFPARAVAQAAERARAVVVAELNLGQLTLAVEAAVAGRAPVHPLLRADGGLLEPEAIARFARSAAAGKARTAKEAMAGA